MESNEIFSNQNSEARMRGRGLNCKLFFMTAFFMVPFGLISIENKKFDDFFDAQDERELKKIQEKEASIRSVSEKYILAFFYFGNQSCSNDAAYHLLNLATKYNWLTYAISLDGIFVEGFENNKINNGIYAEFQNRANAPYRDFIGPSLFFFNPKNNDIHWILSGAAEFKELEDLIYTRNRYFRYDLR